MVYINKDIKGKPAERQGRKAKGLRQSSGWQSCDVPTLSRYDRIRRLSSGRIKFLAEKVETREDFEQALEMGYSYFQGYFFSKPVIISCRDVPVYKLYYLHILQEINKPDTDFEGLESIVKRNVSLSYKLLKFINCAAFGFRTKITLSDMPRLCWALMK